MPRTKGAGRETGLRPAAPPGLRVRTCCARAGGSGLPLPTLSAPTCAHGRSWVPACLWRLARGPGWGVAGVRRRGRGLDPGKVRGRWREGAAQGREGAASSPRPRPALPPQGARRCEP